MVARSEPIVGRLAYLRVDSVQKMSATDLTDWEKMEEFPVTLRRKVADRKEYWEGEGGRLNLR